MQRREFIKAGAAAVAMPAILRAAAADQKIRMGFIGVGNRGTQLMHLFMNFPDVEVTALCDVYEPYLHRREQDFDPKFLEWGLKGRLPSFTAKDGSLKRHEAAVQHTCRCAFSTSTMRRPSATVAVSGFSQ